MGAGETGSERQIAFRTLGGDGPDCVLLHGFGSDRLSWLGTTPALLPLTKVHAMDLPGHGESGMEVGDGSPMVLSQGVEAALDERQLSRVQIVAHSLGGGIALLLAQRRPDLVAGLMLIAPAGLGQGADPEFLGAYPDLTDAEATLVLLRRLVVRPNLISKPIAMRALEQLNKPGARDALRRIATQLVARDAELHTAAMTVAGTSIPHLVIWGSGDTINHSSNERLAAFGGEQHIMPDTGHLPHIEAPKQVNPLLAGFLARSTGR